VGWRATIAAIPADGLLVAATDGGRAQMVEPALANLADIQSLAWGHALAFVHTRTAGLCRGLDGCLLLRRVRALGFLVV
jgi:hypothetical protein